MVIISCISVECFRPAKGSKVEIAGSECTITSQQSTEIVCITGATGVAIKAPVDVYIDNIGKARGVSPSYGIYHCHSESMTDHFRSRM